MRGTGSKMCVRGVNAWSVSKTRGGGLKTRGGGRNRVVGGKLGGGGINWVVGFNNGRWGCKTT
jgi:hypothetical protein